MTTAETTAFEGGKMTRRRWVICGLLFTAVVINYVDRQMLGVLKPFMSDEMGWSETDYA
ncbi:MAG: MFS transporter, partial [Phenylobacterium sp.]|nr:MFS transporter [Phenylobacterium sp.]